MSKPGADIRDSYLVYSGFAPLSWGVCHLRVIHGTQRTLLVASEIRHNPGPSVTNAIEGVWTAIKNKFPQGLLGSDPILIEHYNDQAVYGERGLGERLALANVQNGHTSWRHICPDEIALLAGCATEDLVVPLDQLVIHKGQGGLN